MIKNLVAQFFRVTRTLVAILLLNAFLVLPLESADEPTVEIRRISGKIQIDGVLDEAEWQESPSVVNLVQVEPHPGESPTESTKVWLAYDKAAIYIAVRCEDRNPKQIVATEMKRDAYLEGNDNIEILLDTYHDNRNAYYFSTNAAGALVDGRVT